VESLDPTPKVLYVAGMTRSGTTLIGSVLNALPGFVDVGEIRSYWRAMREGRVCGCGVRVPDCEFWSQVAAWMEERFGPIPLDRALLLQRRVRSLPSPLLRMATTRNRASGDAAEYARLVAQLYAAIGAISGATVIVDTSKGPHDAYALSKFTGVDLNVVHLVRDPRGVAHSWSRYKRVPDNTTGYFERRSATTVAVRWVARNALTETLLARRLGSHFARLRYEDFVADPNGAVARIARMCGVPVTEAPVRAGAITLSGNHSVSGNPDRLTRGSIQVRLDRGWLDEMPLRSRLATTAVSAPLMLRYGYAPGRPR
jgi:hypothetical protein